MTVWTVMSTYIHIAQVNIIKYQWLTPSISTIHYCSDESIIRGFPKSLNERQRHVLRSFLSGTRRTLRTGFYKKGLQWLPFSITKRHSNDSRMLHNPADQDIALHDFEPTVDYYEHTRRCWKSWHEEDRWGRRPSEGAVGTHGSTHTLDWQEIFQTCKVL